MHDEVASIIRKTIGLKNRYMIGMEDIMKAIKVLYERNTKASEYIEENCIDDEFFINLTPKEKGIIEVLKILKGDDENEK